MIAFILSEKDGNSEIEKLGYSYETLNIFDKSLSYYQDLCLEFGEYIEKHKINADDLTTVKRILEATNEEYSVFFYECCFFDFSISDIINYHKNSKGFITSYFESNKLVLSLASNNELKEIFLKDFSCNSIFEYLKNYSQIIIPDFYYIFLDTYNSYKQLNFDILSSKTNVFIPGIAKGVFTDGKLPKGDYTIIPPVYISENSQIESGALIGPSAVVLKNSLVACDSRIGNSILCENTFVSNDCLIENSICGRNSSVKRGAAVLSECVLGYDSVLGDDMYIENGDVVLPETKVISINSLYNSSVDITIEDGNFKNLNVVSACKLGCVFGKIFNSPPVCIGNDNNMVSSTVKLAFISGLCSSGCDCFDIGSSFLNKLFYTSYFCKLRYSFFFSFDENGVSLKIFNENCDELKKSDMYNLLHSYKNFKAKDIVVNNVKKIKQIKGIGKLYVRDLKNLLPDKLSKIYNISCNNLSIKKVVDNILKMKQAESKKISPIQFFIDDFGAELSCVLNEKLYNHSALCDVLDELVGVDFNNDFISFLYNKDAVVLLFKIISYIEEVEDNFTKIKKLLENYSVIEKDYLYSHTTGKFISYLLFNMNSEYKNGKLYINCNEQNVSFKINPSTKNLRLVVKCFDTEASQEMSKEIDAFLGEINNL